MDFFGNLREKTWTDICNILELRVRVLMTRHLGREFPDFFCSEEMETLGYVGDPNEVSYMVLGSDF